MSTRITLTTSDCEASIEVEREDLTVDAIVESLIKPVLLAVGYHPDSVKGALGDE